MRHLAAAAVVTVITTVRLYGMNEFPFMTACNKNYFVRVNNVCGDGFLSHRKEREVI